MRTNDARCQIINCAQLCECAALQTPLSESILGNVDSRCAVSGDTIAPVQRTQNNQQIGNWYNFVRYVRKSKSPIIFLSVRFILNALKSRKNKFELYKQNNDSASLNIETT